MNITKLFLFNRLFFILLLTINLTFLNLNCSKNENADFIDEDQFVDILARLMIIEQLKIGQTEKLPLIKQVFKEYHTDNAAFNAYKKRYENDTKHWINIYKKVEKRIRELSSPNKLLTPKNYSKRDTNAVRHKE